MSGNLENKFATGGSNAPPSGRPREPPVYVLLTKSSTALLELFPPEEEEEVKDVKSNIVNEVARNEMIAISEGMSEVQMNVPHHVSAPPPSTQSQSQLQVKSEPTVQFPAMKKPLCLLFEDTMSADYWNSLYQTSEFWTCLYCGEKFLIKSLLKSHANEHRDEKNYSVSKTCADCGEYFHMFSEYVRHMSRTGHMSDHFYGSAPTANRPSLRQPSTHNPPMASHSPTPRLYVDVSASVPPGLGFGNSSVDAANGDFLPSPTSSSYHGRPSPTPAASGNRSPFFNQRFDSASNMTSLNSVGLNHNRSSIPHTGFVDSVSADKNTNGADFGVIGIKSINKSVQVNLFFSGLLRDARGPGSCSWLLLDAISGTMVSQGATLLHPGTVPLCPTRADYEGLLMGIKTCAVKQISRIRVHSCSEAVLSNIRSSGGIKQAPVYIQELNSTVQRFLSTFERVEFEYVPPQRNQYATDLARNCLVSHTGTKQGVPKLNVSVDTTKGIRDYYSGVSSASSGGYTTGPSTASLSPFSPSYHSSSPSHHNHPPPFSPSNVYAGLGLDEHDSARLGPSLNQVHNLGSNRDNGKDRNRSNFHSSLPRWG